VSFIARTRRARNLRCSPIERSPRNEKGRGDARHSKRAAIVPPAFAISVSVARDPIGSARQELDDEVDVDGQAHVVDLRKPDDLDRQLLRVDGEEVRGGAVVLLDAARVELLKILSRADLDDVARAQDRARHVGSASVDEDVRVRRGLARLSAGTREPGAPDDVVEAALANLQQVLARVPRHLLREIEEAHELALAQSVIVTDLLLLDERAPVIGGAPTARAVHSGGIRPPARSARRAARVIDVKP